MKIIGIDPSITATGCADAEGGLFTIKYPKTVTGDARLNAITKALPRMHGLDLAIIEDLPTHAHGAGITGMVQGVIRHHFNAAGLRYITVPPASLKTFATGKGNATKGDMRMAWYQRTGADVRDDNQVDAAWLRQLGLHIMGAPEFTLPATHLRALDKLPRQ